MNDITALILDDEEFTINALIEEISWEKCGISNAAGVCSVRKAKEFLKQHTANILICDIEMPGESGLDLVEWATEYARFSGSPMVCLMLTCHPEYNFLRKAMQLGCIDYILKPAITEELENSLKKAADMIRKLQFSQQFQEKYSDNTPETGKSIIKSRVLPYIEKHISEPFSVSEIAEHVSLNPQYMMRIFKKITGLSFLEYVTNRRIELAKEMLLSTSWSIEKISEKLGYCSYTYFSKVFKKNIGKSPGEYRKQYGK